MSRKFHVALLEHVGGVSVSCPELPGCHSKGRNAVEAMQNIRDAAVAMEAFGAADTSFRHQPKIQSIFHPNLIV